MIEPLITKKQVCEILSMSLMGISRKMKDDPDFPKPIKYGTTRQSKVYFKPSEIQEYINKKQVK